MQQEFLELLATKFSFLQGKKLLIACSGGVDSMVLVNLCLRNNLLIAIGHCNFNLRGEESNADEAFVTQYAKAHNVPVYIKHFDTETYKTSGNYSIQMAARNLRYEWFQEIKEHYGFDYILTAHHADDSLETFLINLSRGTGIDGLKGIPEKNKFIVRPLLYFFKDTIIAYANQENLKWREDGSNASTKYIRNKLRIEVIPKLKEIHPNFFNNFLQTQSFLQATATIQNQAVTNLKAELFTVLQDRTIQIKIDSLIKLNPLKDYLYHLFKEFNFTNWVDIENLLTAQSGKYIISSTHRISKDRDALFIEKLVEENNTQIYRVAKDTTIITTPVHLTFTEVTEITNKSVAIVYVDIDVLKFPLLIKKYNKGDYFYPFGMEKKKKRLSKFFKDEKYTLKAKEDQWLLCSGEDIVWVIGKRADERFKIKPSTTRILKIELLEK